MQLTFASKKNEADTKYKVQNFSSIFIARIFLNVINNNTQPKKVTKSTDGIRG